MDPLDEQDIYEPSSDAPTKKKELVELLQRRGFGTKRVPPPNMPALTLAPPPSRQIDATLILVTIGSILAMYGGYSLGKDIYHLCSNLFSKELSE
jgi:hypothetical protein